MTFEQIYSEIKEKHELDQVKELIKKGFFRDPASYDFVYTYPPVQSLKEFKGDWRPIFKFDAKEKYLLYVHIPFCTGKCSYCYFLTCTANPELYDKYLDTLKMEAELITRESKPIVSAILIGGGTPSILSEAQLVKLFKTIYDNFSISKEAEITFEVEPHKISDEKIKVLKEYKVNRINIGIQTFSDYVLKPLMLRRHDSQEALEYINKCKQFEKLNVDIIYGYPGQEPEGLYRDIEKVLDLDIPSVTFYQLWTKNKTKLKKQIEKYRDIMLPSIEDNILMRILIKKSMEKNGYSENLASWYFKDDRYMYKLQDMKWQNHPLIGIGISSYGYLNNTVYVTGSDFPEWSASYNSNVISKLRDYFESIDGGRIPVSKAKSLDSEDALRRAVVLGIKRAEGVSLDDLAFRVKYPKNPYLLFESALDFLLKNGLIEERNGRICLTPKGFLFDDEVSKSFFKGQE